MSQYDSISSADKQEEVEASRLKKEILVLLIPVLLSFIIASCRTEDNQSPIAITSTPPRPTETSPYETKETNPFLTSPNTNELAQALATLSPNETENLRRHLYFVETAITNGEVTFDLSQPFTLNYPENMHPLYPLDPSQAEALTYTIDPTVWDDSAESEADFENLVVFSEYLRLPYVGAVVSDQYNQLTTLIVHSKILNDPSQESGVRILPGEPAVQMEDEIIDTRISLEQSNGDQKKTLTLRAVYTVNANISTLWDESFLKIDDSRPFIDYTKIGLPAEFINDNYVGLIACDADSLSDADTEDEVTLIIFEIE